MLSYVIVAVVSAGRTTVVEVSASVGNLFILMVLSSGLLYVLIFFRMSDEGISELSVLLARIRILGLNLWLT